MSSSSPADLRGFARGKVCQARVPGICNHDSSTVVLAHVRIPGVTGLAVKSNDLAAMHACNCCHDALDGRTRWPAYLGHKATYILEAMVRTIDAVCREHKLIRL